MTSERCWYCDQQQDKAGVGREGGQDAGLLKGRAMEVSTCATGQVYQPLLHPLAQTT